MENGHCSQTKFLTEKEVSQITGFALPTLRNWRFQNKGPVYRKFGSRCIRYSLSDVLRYMDYHKVEVNDGAER